MIELRPPREVALGLGGSCWIPIPNICITARLEQDTTKSLDPLIYTASPPVSLYTGAGTQGGKSPTVFALLFRADPPTVRPHRDLKLDNLPIGTL